VELGLDVSLRETANLLQIVLFAQPELDARLR
jgi:type II secretory pathway predicted ATPase ExeA